MPYVIRDGSGKVTGLRFNAPRTDPVEFLPDDDSEIIAYHNPPPPLPEDTPDTVADVIAMLKALNLPGASAAQIDAALTTAKRNRP